RAALSADSRVRPQIVTHGLEQGPPRAAERIAVSHRRPDGVENPRLALSRHLREDLHQRDGVIVTLDVPPDAYRGAGDVPACNEVTEVAAVVGANPLLVRTHDVAEPVEHRPVIHRRLKVALHSLDPLFPPSPFFLAE